MLTHSFLFLFSGNKRFGLRTGEPSAVNNNSSNKMEHPMETRLAPRSQRVLQHQGLHPVFLRQRFLGILRTNLLLLCLPWLQGLPCLTGSHPSSTRIESPLTQVWLQSRQEAACLQCLPQTTCPTVRSGVLLRWIPWPISCQGATWATVACKRQPLLIITIIIKWQPRLLE